MVCYGFETGDFSEFDSTEVTPMNATLTISSSEAVCGSYCERAHISGIFPSEHALAVVDVDKQFFYTQFYVKTSDIASLSNQDVLFYFIASSVAPENDIFRFGIWRNDGGGGILWYAMMREGDSGWIGNSSLTNPYSENELFCVEIWLVIADGIGAYQVWINGDLVIDISNRDNDNKGNVGKMKYGAESSNDSPIQATVFIDDIQISNMRINACTQCCDGSWYEDGDGICPPTSDVGTCSGNCAIHLGYIHEMYYENFHTLHQMDQDFGETFISLVTAELCETKFYLQRIGSIVGGYLIAELYLADGNYPYAIPIGSPLARSSLVSTTCIPTDDFTFISFFFPRGTTLQSGVQYAVLVSSYAGTFDGSNNIRVGHSITHEFDTGNQFYRTGAEWISSGEALVPNDHVIFYVCGRQTGSGGCPDSQMQTTTLGSEDLGCTHLIPPMAGG